MGRSGRGDQRTTITRWDTVLRALAAEPRRELLVSLLEAPAERDLSLPEAANPPHTLREPRRLSSELIHCHLPVLADAGLIEWERDPLPARRGPRFEEAAAVVSALRDERDEFPRALRTDALVVDHEARRER